MRALTRARRSGGGRARRALVFLAWACLLAAAPGRSGAQAAPAGAAGAHRPVALVTGLEGEARVQRPEGAHLLRVLDTLANGEDLTLAAGAQAEVVVTVGAERVYELRGPGRFALRASAVSVRGKAGRIEVRDLVGNWRALQLQPGMVGRASVSLRGYEEAVVVTRAPAGGQRAAAARRLQWEAPPGYAPPSWDYVVSVVDPQGATIFRAHTREPFLQLPDALALQRGAAYVWTVDATDEQGWKREGVAEFRIVEAPVERRVQSAQQAAEQARLRFPQDPLRAEDVLFTLVLDQAGLRNEADERWHELARARPAFRPWSDLAR
jgi:hypothetical protein